MAFQENTEHTSYIVFESAQTEIQKQKRKQKYVFFGGITLLSVLGIVTLLYFLYFNNQNDTALIGNENNARSKNNKVIEIPLKRGKFKNNFSHFKHKYPALYKTPENDDEKRRLQTDVSLSTDDYAYYCDIYVGSDSQSIVVQFDTGSSNLWVSAEGCSGCPSSDRFDSSSSSTYTDKSTPLSLKYGSGSATGSLGEDSVTLGSVSATLEFGVISSASGFSTVKWSGIFGLAYQGLAQDYVTPPFNTFVESGEVSQNMFAMHLTTSGGTLTLGGYDTSKSLWYTPITQQLYYQVSLNQFLYGTTAISSSTVAILDSGTSFIVGPEDGINTIASAAGATLTSNGLYKVACGQSYPDISITLGSGSNTNTFTLSYSDFIVTSGLECYMEIGTVSGQTFWILGDTFIRKYYTVFDIANSQMGFAAN